VRALLLAAQAAGALVFAGVVAVGLLYVRLMHGPIALDFLARQIETGIAAEFAGTAVRVDSVALGLNENGLLQFELKNVRVSNERGEPLVTAPSAAISLSRGALFRGRVAVETIDLMAARLLLFYSEDGTLSLKFSGAATGGDGDQAGQSGLRGSVGAPAPAASGDGDGALGRIDLVKALSEASASARRKEHASAYLRGVGLRSAIVIIDNGGRRSIWRVPEFDLDLDHARRRSHISGRAKIESFAGPWELKFKSYEHIRNKALNLAVSVRALVPRGLARILPQLVALEGIDVPVSGDAQLEISTGGEVLSGKIEIQVAQGRLSVPGLMQAPVRVDSGRLELAYDGAASRFEIAPSTIAWGGSQVQFAGAIRHAPHATDGHGWALDIQAISGSVAADVTGEPALPIDQLAIQGFLAPDRGRMVLEKFLLRAGGTQVDAFGDVSALGEAVKARLEARIGPMTAEVFKTLWPSWAAPQTRSWVVERLVRGELRGGTFKMAHGFGPPTAAGGGDRLALALEGADLELALMPGWPGLEMPRGLLRVEGRMVEFAAPEGSMTAADGRKLALKGSFTVDMDEPLPRHGHVAVRGHGSPSLLLEMLDRETQRAWREAGVALTGGDGKAEGSLKIKLPLVPQLQFRDARTEGRLRISDAKVRQISGPLEAQGVNLVIDMTPTAMEAKGDLLIKGVPAKVSWQHVHGAAAHKQPPLRIAASLDGSERTQLGLDVNEMVQGVVAVEVTVGRDAQGGHQVHVHADLVNASLTLEGLGWHKPVGQACTFEFDLAKGAAYPTELHNVKLRGESVAIAGWMGAGQDLQVKEFRFPQFSLNIVTSFEAHGKLRPDNVWEVTARGPRYDGRELFQSFFDIRLAVDKGGKHRPGLDLRAEIDTVLGFYETSMRSVHVTMQKRAGKMVQLDARGLLAGNKPFEATVRREPSRPRALVAKAADAGQMFRLVGFYPHAVGGEMALEVNLEGQGAAERTGLLTASRFYVLGDAVTVKTDGAPNRRRSRKGSNELREKFEFTSLRAPFEVGHGQFVLKDAAIEGPLVSANMRGKIDFRTRRLQVGGTFTPLSTLNKLPIFTDVPLVGDLVTGPRRDGVFAVTYALQGGLENPQLVFNPFSGIMPGITREFMQITPEDPQVVPRGKQGGRGEGGARSSSSPPSGPGADDEAEGPADAARPARRKK
jgi:hypothetical protein